MKFEDLTPEDSMSLTTTAPRKPGNVLMNTAEGRADCGYINQAAI